MTNWEIVKFDAQNLVCEPWGNESNTAVKTSLRLQDTGKCGSKITWSSSDKSVITEFGRVIRPKWNQEPTCVTMTAVITYADATAVREFQFTVLPDESFVDPQYETDQSFFEKLDERKGEVAKMKETARSGKIREAKAELLQYMRQKEYPEREWKVGLPDDLTGICRMMSTGVSSLQRCDRFYIGTFSAATCDYAKQKIPLRLTGLKNGATVTYDISSLYNEMVGIKIAGNQYGDESMRPVLELVTDSQVYLFSCADCAVLGAGKNAKNAFNIQKELQVKLFGEFWGDETFHSLLKFHINHIVGEIKEANLILHVKKDMQQSGEKELLILMFPENIWEGSKTKWSDFKWQFANRNGLPQPDKWVEEAGFDFEYLYQRTRFLHFPWMEEEYKQNQNEELLYCMIKTMTDFIKAQGMPRTYTGGHEHIGSAWCNDTISRTLCGGWPRGLDAAERIDSFSKVFGTLVKSEYMTPDACITILKYAWDACDALAFKSLTKPITNLRQFEVTGLLHAAAVFDDFKEQPAWIKKGNEIMEQMMFSVTMEDGTYRETTGGYNESVCQNFIQFKKLSMENGSEQSVQFDERLKKFAQYNALLRGPNGESLQYGDCGAGTMQGILYPELIDWFGEEELTFLLTRGVYGKRPEWTSFHFQISSTIMLRSGWETEAVYLFTQARGGGSHGHQDDNHITLIADGNILLTDAGIFTYTEDDAYRKWGKSPLAHNTICINEMAQIYGAEPGICHEFITDALCDIICQGTNRYEGFTYNRRIVFIKPNLFLITDELIPEDLEQENNYKQPWHMMPAANMSFDYEHNCLRSHFEKGANLLIRSLDCDVVLTRNMGWYDYGYQQLAENPFGCFEKTGVKGCTSFHTVLKIFDSDSKENVE